jgi:hypothetical protein
MLSSSFPFHTFEGMKKIRMEGSPLVAVFADADNLARVAKA